MNNSQNSGPSFARTLFILSLAGVLLAGIRECNNQSSAASNLYLNSPLLNPTPVNECGDWLNSQQQQSYTSYTF